MRPAKPGPRTKPPEERRDELMTAAQRLFLEHGAGPTTIEQITTAAGVAKGTFYLYFSSKEDVLTALGDRYAREHLERIRAAVDERPADDWAGKLTAWAGTSVVSYLDSIHLHDVAFYEARTPTREGLVDNIVIDHLSELLQAGVDAGAWTVADPRFTAVFLFSGCHGVVDDAYAKEKRVNRSRLVERLEQLCFRAVGLPSD
ncbi:TetR/AcrR family transcriptional regulator [Fimbriiglobus ruber]|uniref:Transcriptional regulator, TetR family n=1 Tax=Fimbriiglobus ruber TaxID=1908690 RepID=A0A225DMK8_9BACT|nr:TetR/AcrR family transcriptional regulator [Fimbriiglobus ruber]OWK37655.1 Transcriptional regulator, TetR family [Fimbriiglobus ruber]